MPQEFLELEAWRRTRYRRDWKRGTIQPMQLKGDIPEGPRPGPRLGLGQGKVEEGPLMSNSFNSLSGFLCDIVQ